ncbi:conserved hypothetical protein [Ricinus communis]|uniref:Uncharacterized protein n=1 Tax=Ricinus communis TaxID=3988 RepID=B9TEW5_RICCO|nr:conserved hypothetical protein [Ricinus communis]
MKTTTTAAARPARPILPIQTIPMIRRWPSSSVMARPRPPISSAVSASAITVPHR